MNHAKVFGYLTHTSQNILSVHCSCKENSLVKRN